MDATHLPSHAWILQGGCLESLEAEAFRLASQWLETEAPHKHPDCLVLRPLNKMWQVSVDQVQALIEFVNQSSLQGGKKVCVLIEADRLTTGASNAFLKTLEEPPSGTHFLLLTTRPEAILPTIRSRTQCLRLKADPSQLAKDDWVQWLDAYRIWLIKAAQKPTSTRDVADRVMGLYQLLHALELHLDEEPEPTNGHFVQMLDEEQQEIYRAGFQKRRNKGLWQNLLQATQKNVVESTSHEKLCQRLPILQQALLLIENNATLLEANLSFTSALEDALLKIARIWVA